MELNDMTARELVAIHDGRCQPERRIGGAWKRSKDELIGLVEALGTPKVDAVKPSVTDLSNPEPPIRVGRTVAALLMDAELSYLKIVEEVRRQFPDAKTTVRSVASVASVMRKKGAEVPMRKRHRLSDDLP